MAAQRVRLPPRYPTSHSTSLFPSPSSPPSPATSSWFAPPARVAPPGGRPRFQERCVHEIHCLHCDDVKSERGMEAVCLSTKESKFSTDATPLRIAIPQHCEMVAYCRCLASEFHCTVCGNGVGYVVVVPCSMCSSKNNNHHRYIFDPSSVTATLLKGTDGLPTTWSALRTSPWPGRTCIGR